ncbi:MAG TPA: hypothetical protein DCS97_08590, partial [Planctomycetes bacterium]|nr:hypothetical protein [Planctomycetota bacterium]
MRISVLCALFTLPSLLPALSVEEFRALPDDREAVRSSYGLRRVAVLSSERIEVEVGHSASPAVENPKAWRILSEDDPAYAYERFITPVRATVRKETEVEAPDGCAIPRFERRFVVLDLPAPLQEG